MIYAARTNNKDILLNSSAGGIFWELATKILDDGGVIFGAAWNSEWDVDIIPVTDVSELHFIMGSKYVLANVKDSFRECEEYLKAGKSVLYSALPCQIHGLKKYLKQDYPNLFCVEVCCHGTMPRRIWHDYLKSICHFGTISSINMRDKSNGWRDYSVKIEWDNGKVLTQHHNDNAYIQAYLSDKYLRSCCYKCNYKNENSVADILIGDFWGIDNSFGVLNDNRGANIVITRTARGQFLFDSINNIEKREITIREAIRCNGGMQNNIKTQPEKWNATLFQKKIGIMTLGFCDNVGGILQNYALQRVVKNLGFTPTTIKLKGWGYSNPFIKKHINIKEYANTQSIPRKDFDGLIIGSDQVWRKEWSTCDYGFALFASSWNIPIISYAASCGKDYLEFGQNALNKLIVPALNKMRAISVREYGLRDSLQNLLKGKQVEVVCDPAFLLSKDDYVGLCANTPIIDKKIGIYFLDDHPEELQKILNDLHQNEIDLYRARYGDVEGFLATFRDCEKVITDSFHGVVFSLIFNKPFIFIINDGRGAARFETLLKTFDISPYLYNSQINKIDEKPNQDEQITKIRKAGLEFLQNICF